LRLLMMMKIIIIITPIKFIKVLDYNKKRLITYKYRREKSMNDKNTVI
jgi:hypothetical protein